MSEISLFFNSTFDDPRRYTAGDIAQYWKSFLSTGLISWDGEPMLRVVADGETNVIKIKPGRAIVEGHLYRNRADLPKEIPLPESKGSRIDRVVLRLHEKRGEKYSRYVRSFIKEGTADNPPELERTFIEGDAIVYELSLAQVRIREGVTYITQDDIIDERLDEELCGMSSSLVSVPTEIFGEQWRDFVDEYYSWFEGIKNEMYATEKEVRQRDHALKREIAYLEMMLEADRRIKNGVIFADNFTGNPYNIECLKGKAELAEDVEPNDRELKFINAHDFHEDIKEITIYDQEKQERLEIGSIEGDTIHLSKPIVNGFEAQAMLFESVHQIEDGYMKVGEVPSGMTVELNNIDLRDVYEEWYIYEGHFYLISNESSGGISEKYDVYHFDITTKKLNRLLGSGNLLENDVFITPMSRGILACQRFSDRAIRLFYIVDGEVIDTLEYSWSENWNGNLIKPLPYATYTALQIRSSYSTNMSISILRENNGRITEITKDVESSSYNGSSGQVLDGERYLYYQHRMGDYTRVLIKNVGEVGRGTQIYSANGRFDFPISMTDGSKVYMVFLDPTYYRLTLWKNGITEVIGIDGVIEKVFNDGYYYYFVSEVGTVYRWRFDKFEEVKNTVVSIDNIVTPYLIGKEKDVPFHLKSKRYATGRFFEGVIFEPKEADIRFRIPKTKEVVAYIENNGLGEYSGWFNQHSTADKEMGNEIQMIGTSSDDYDTFRLTVKRESVDEDNRITRILGGVL